MRASYRCSLMRGKSSGKGHKALRLIGQQDGVNDVTSLTPLPLPSNRAHIYSNYGSLLLQMREDVMAVTMLDKALELNPKSVDLSLAKAAALKHLGLNDEALACLDQAIVQNPSASNLLMSE